MNENSSDQPAPLQRRDPEPFEASPKEPNPRLSGARRGHAQPSGGKLQPGFDVWTALDLLLSRWHWPVLGAILFGGLFFLLGWHFVRPKFTATAQLQRVDPPGKSEYFKSTPISGDTFAAVLRAPDLLSRVGAQASPPIPPEVLAKISKVDPDPDSDMVKILLAARDPRQAVDLLNIYITNAVNYVRDLDAQQAARLANQYLSNEVAQLDGQIQDLQEQFRKLPTGAVARNRLANMGSQLHEVSTNLAVAPQTSMFGVTQQFERLQKALAELDKLRADYSDQNPKVISQKELVTSLQKEANATLGGSTNGGVGALAPAALALTGTSEAFNAEVDIINIKLRALEDAKVELSKRLSEAKLYASSPPETVKIFAPADIKTIKHNFRRAKIGIVTIFGGILGMGASMVLVLLVEFFDNRIKTPEDVKRVTKLPVLTTLGDLQSMKAQERAQWAFRTWTMLQGRLSPSANHGLVCGITSSAPGEGRSTWISLLAEAASMTGFRVLTIATRPSPTHVEPNGHGDGDGSNGHAKETAPTNGKENHASNGASNAITTSVLATPAQVTDKLTGPNSQPMVHIPLPGWVWNLERRKQWREALSHWRQIDNLVILVELPPAGVPEAVLLGSNLPNMLWLSDSGKAHAGETRAQLETLRHARCNLVGAVLNRQQGAPLKRRFPRWIDCFALGLLTVLSAQAQVTNQNAASLASAPTATRAEAVSTGNAAPQDAPRQGSFSIVRPEQRPAWLKHLTLGPGDLLTLNLYGHPELTRTEVAIGPDGRLSYLEAQDVQAAGLTVDELRTNLDGALAQWRRAPRSIVTPIAYRSKKYYVLGKVATKGVFVWDRPITVAQALARAHGLESALVDRNLYDLADFSHSFLARSGKRYPIDFEKLFQQGDLSQNIAVEPGDYIYFAPADLHEVYVVGEVRLPGPVTYYRDLTIMGAITARGGYTDRAYKARVLVIRGSLQHPEAIPVDTHAVLNARELDFKLKPRDVIFVNSRPFIRVEEAADLAATAFIQSIITSWVGVDVVKPINQ